jgi:hypothetical protein
MTSDWAAILGADDGLQLGRPASADSIDQAEAELGVDLPQDLRALYAVTDGVLERRGQWYVIWSLSDAVSRNLKAYSIEPPGRAALVGFGDDGTGAPFCISRDGGTAVSYWSPIAGEATWLAEDLASFWSGWRTGQLPPH